jgi:hypothetical protein
MPWTRKKPERVIGLLAGQIRDPVLRLRFLRRFAPRIHRPRNRAVARLALQIVPTVLLAMGGSFLLTRTTEHFPRRGSVGPAPVPNASDWSRPVWQVEQTAEFETWSNGLRVDNRFRASGHQMRSGAPAGIMLISSAPQGRDGYNFFVDRFGRVYRIVPESEAPQDAVDQNFVTAAIEAGGSADQSHAKSLLVQMLRSRFAIPAANVITR